MIKIGWREWVALPDLGIHAVKAKIDTGARTSALHAVDIERFIKDGEDWISFLTYPRQRDTSNAIRCEARVFDDRIVRDSGGHEALRPTIFTHINMGGTIWPIEMTLANRERMRFRMLIGRTTMADRCLIDPSQSFLAYTDQVVPDKP